MATLTSTGAVNLTSSTNWSPAQTPVAGDDLIIGAHTLTLDADMTLNSITLSSGSARFAISGTTRSVGATNGFTINNVSISNQLITAAIPSGTSLTLTGEWIPSGSSAALSAGIASSTGGNLTLQTVGGSTSSSLFRTGTSANARIITTSWTGGTLTTTGLVDLSVLNATIVFVTISGGTWQHNSVGTNYLGYNSVQRWANVSGTATINWTGSVDSSSIISGSGLFALASTSTSNTIGQSGDVFLQRSHTATANSFTSIVYSNNSSSVVELVGNFLCRLDAVAIQIAGGTVRWRNQSVSLTSSDFCFINNTGGTMDMSGLVVTNAGKFLYVEYGGGSTTTTSGTSITNSSTSAMACSWGTTALDGKIVVLESSPATLPTNAQVAAGVSYGYSGAPQTGTGLIMDPATLATAMLTSFGSLPQVLINTTIAARTSETVFTLTAGSSDDGAYVGQTLVVTKSGSSTRKEVGTVSAYVGSTRQVTLTSDPGVMTIAAGDTVQILTGGSSGGSSFPSSAPTDWLGASGIAANAFTAAKFAAGSLNGKGDWSTYAGGDTAGTTTLLARLNSTRAGNLDLLDVAISTLQSQITALNNLSAKCNWFGNMLLEIPDSGSRAYVFELVVKDDEDKLVNLDAAPTITLTNSAGTDRSSLITTGIASVATGRYTLTITVGTSTTNEALTLRATGTVSGETRYAVLTTQVVDYDSATLINSIYTRLGAPATSSIAGDIAATKTVMDTVAADTTTLKGRITSTLFSGITYLSRWLGALAGKTADSSTLAEINATPAGAGFNNTTDSLEAIRDRGDAAWTTGSGGGGGSGTGARTVTITVNDGTTALQNAIVRMSEGASSYTATTNASGVATFNLDDATYTVAITKQGYTYAGTTLAVDGTESQTYSMTQISITPGSGSATTGYVTCLDNTGTAEAGVTVYTQMIDAPTSGTGYAYDASVRTVTSDEDGVAELTGMIKGATYQLWRGKRATGRTVTIPSDAGSTYALPSLVGE